MPKIVHYEALSSKNLITIDRYVKVAMENGCQPFGNLLFDGESYIQVVVRYEEQPK